MMVTPSFRVMTYTRFSLFDRRCFGGEVTPRRHETRNVIYGWPTMLRNILRLIEIDFSKNLNRSLSLPEFLGYTLRSIQIYM